MKKLDRYDLAILQTLQEKGRITKVALAQTVNLTPTPCWERMRSLEKMGYITCYRACVDIRKLAPITEVIVEVSLTSHRSRDFERFEAAIQGVPQVVECLATGGGIDYVMKVIVHDVDAYQQLMDRLLDAEIGIDRYFSYIVTKRTKSTPPSLTDLVKLP